MMTNLIQQIEQFNTIMIIGHRYPDGDCYGTQVGLKELIVTRYPKKKVFVVGSGFAPAFDILGKPDVIEDHLFQGSLAICVDTSDMERLEDPRHRLAAQRFKLDHHIDSYPFQGDAWVNTHAIAAAEMVTTLAYSERWAMTQKAAWALAMGIITDSNRFLYDLVTEKTFHLMAYLLQSGIQLNDIYTRIYKNQLSSFPVKQFVYTNTKQDARGILYCVFTQADLARLGLTPIQAVGQVNLLAQIEGFPIWFMAAEGDQQVHVEIRSSNVEVQSLALRYGGGGHLKASGFRLPSLEHIPTMINQIKVK
jgi:phosphoesterase RecJ-like protein